MTGIRTALVLLGPSPVVAAGTSDEGQTMSSTRRILIVVGLTLAVIIGASLPASATYADSASVRTTTIETGTVAPPTSVEAKGICATVIDPVTGTAISTVHAKVEWQRSRSSDITGYRVTAHLNNGSSVVMAQTDASGDEVYSSSLQAYVAYRPTFSVTTLTSYGWTAVSARSNVLSC